MVTNNNWSIYEYVGFGMDTGEPVGAHESHNP